MILMIMVNLQYTLENVPMSLKFKGFIEHLAINSDFPFNKLN